MGEGLFAALGRGIARHPWYPIIFWLVLLAVAAPFLSKVGSVTTNSATTLPDTAPSQVAAAEIERLFPNQSAASESLLLFTGANVTNASSQAILQAVTAALVADRSLQYVSGVDSLYTGTQGYFSGMAEISLGVIAGAENATPPLSVAVNQTSYLLWGPSALYVSTWSALVAAQPTQPPNASNYPAFVQTSQALGPGPASQLVLSTFYNGANSNGNGFNGTAACASSPPTVVACADAVNVAQVGSIASSLAPSPAALAIAEAVLGGVAIGNFSSPSSQQMVSSGLLAPVAGLPASFVDQVWTAFPSGHATAAQLDLWAAAVVASGTIWTYPLPVPPAIQTSFVNDSGGAALILVSYSKQSGYTGANGSNPIYDNVDRINALVPQVLARTDPGHTLSYVQTGGAPLDQFESTDLSSNLAIVLPLTIGVLMIITLIYFRSPVTPLVTLAALGISIGLALGGAFLIGTFVTKFDVTTLTLANTFVLGVGTDYAIFIVARYREELFKGASSKEAVITSVTWAGQSVATSGATAVIATLALTFSGLALLSQWGMVLSLAILITVLVSLTIIPALLVLIGPRVFWPTTGARMDRLARRTVGRRAEEKTYFFRAGRVTQRRPRIIATIILVASIPLLYIALNVPLSYDFYGQLPAGHPATEGFQQLEGAFGPGYAFPMAVLIGFASPLLVGNQSNATEFTALGSMTQGISTTHGVASVSSPVGPFGAPLASWVNFGHESVGTQAQLRGILSGYLGNDGKTVLVNVVSASGGLTSESVNLLKSIEAYLSGFAASNPSVTSLAYGGGASVTYDLSVQTQVATERLAIAVSIGLIVVLLVVLRSWPIPLMAVATIGLSIAWAWATTYLVFDLALGYPLFYFVPTILFILILGLGIDYNIFLLTRVREERLRGRNASESVVHAVASTGGIITAAAVILASAFAILTTGNFVLLKAIGFAVAAAVLLDAMVVRTYLVPSLLQMMGEKAWSGFRRKPRPVSAPAPEPGDAAPAPTAVHPS